MRPPARYIDRCAPPRTATARIRFGGGAGQCPGDYFVGPQLGGPRPRPIEMGRDPTASERALGKVPQPAPQLYRIWGLFPLNSDC